MKCDADSCLYWDNGECKVERDVTINEDGQCDIYIFDGFKTITFAEEPVTCPSNK